MGIYCKKSSNPPNISSHKIHKIKSNLLKNKENKFEFLTFDIIEEKIYINKIKFHIITSLKGLSQLNQENSIFLCGGLNEKPYSGSFLIRINYNIIMENSIKFLINSQYVHEYPSMLYTAPLCCLDICSIATLEPNIAPLRSTSIIVLISCSVNSHIAF